MHTDSAEQVTDASIGASIADQTRLLTLNASVGAAWPLDQTAAVPRQRRMARPDAGQRRAPWKGTVLALGAVIVCWIAAVTVGSLFHPVGLLHQVALFVHLTSLVVGFGAVLVLDFYGARCVLGTSIRLRRAASAPRHGARRERPGPVEVARFASTVDPMIWAGLAGLVVSGAVLSPNVDSPATWLKLLAVLAVAFNGINAHHLCAELKSLPVTLTLSKLSTRLKVRLLITGAVSQTAWWIAILVGYWNNL
jgi:hypothetical protein